MTHTLMTCTPLKTVRMTSFNLEAGHLFRLQRLGFKQHETCTVVLRHKHHVVVALKGVRIGLDANSARHIEVDYD